MTHSGARSGYSACHALQGQAEEIGRKRGEEGRKVKKEVGEGG